MRIDPETCELIGCGCIAFAGILAALFPLVLLFTL
jgi:hypothetical protein